MFVMSEDEELFPFNFFFFITLERKGQPYRGCRVEIKIKTTNGLFWFEMLESTMTSKV